MLPIWGPFHKQFFHHNSNSREIFCFILTWILTQLMLQKFYTWHDSRAVLACVKFYCNLMASNEITARHQIWIASKKLLEEQANVPLFSEFLLTHWGQVTHICVGNLVIIGSDNALSPGRRQAITWTNIGILLIGPPGTNFSEIVIKIHAFSFKKIHLKMLSGKWWPFCLGLNVLISNENCWALWWPDSVIHNGQWDLKKFHSIAISSHRCKSIIPIFTRFNLLVLGQSYHLSTMWSKTEEYLQTIHVNDDITTTKQTTTMCTTLMA